MAKLSALTKVGILKEASFGAGGNPSVILPVEPPSFTEPIARFWDNAIRGIPALDFGGIVTTKHIEGSLAGPIFLDEFPYLPLAILGSETFSTVDTTTGKHVFALKTDGLPPSLAVVVDDEVQEWTYKGVRCTSLTMRFSAAEGVLNFSADIVGAEKATSDATWPALGAPGQAPLPGWQGYVQIWDEATSAYKAWANKLIDFEIVFTRDADYRYSLPGTAEGSSSPREIGLSPLSITGTITIQFTDVADEQKYRTGVQDRIKIKVIKDPAKEGVAGEVSCTWELFKIDWGEGAFEVDRTGTTLVATMRFRALWDFGQGKIIDLTIFNTKTAAY